MSKDDFEDLKKKIYDAYLIKRQDPQNQYRQWEKKKFSNRVALVNKNLPKNVKAGMKASDLQKNKDLTNFDWNFDWYLDWYLGGLFNGSDLQKIWDNLGDISEYSESKLDEKLLKELRRPELVKEDFEDLLKKWYHVKYKKINDQFEQKQKEQQMQKKKKDFFKMVKQKTKDKFFEKASIRYDWLFYGNDSLLKFWNKLGDNSEDVESKLEELKKKKKPNIERKYALIVQEKKVDNKVYLPVVVNKVKKKE